MKRVKVTPVVSQTSSKTGALVVVVDAAAASSTAEKSLVEAGEVTDGANAAAELMVAINANTESFIFGCLLINEIDATTK